MHTIITTANTVSRASVGLPPSSPSITEVISATSITVTATVRTRVP